VTKKIGGAVERSRVKRILRAGYDGVKSGLRTGFLIVISPYPQILSVKSTDVRKELRYAFRKLDMMEAQNTPDPSGKGSLTQ
jgi:ribonuclease P protein component